MGDHNIDIQVMQIEDPWNFYVCIKHESSQSVEATQFRRMFFEMNQSMKQAAKSGAYIHKPNVGDVCAALSREDGLWHRVIVEAIVNNVSGLLADCYLIDKGLELRVPVSRLMQLSKKFLDFPRQVYRCCLWGVQPITLKIDETELGFQAKLRPDIEWDPAAAMYMRGMIAKSKGCQAEIVNKDSDMTLYLRLHLLTESGSVCFNEALVSENYATSVDMSEVGLKYENVKGPKSSTTPDVIRDTPHSELSEMPSSINLPMSESHLRNGRLHTSGSSATEESAPQWTRRVQAMPDYNEMPLLIPDSESELQLRKEKSRESKHLSSEVKRQQHTSSKSSYRDERRPVVRQDSPTCSFAVGNQHYNTGGSHRISGGAFYEQHIDLAAGSGRPVNSSSTGCLQNLAEPVRGAYKTWSDSQRESQKIPLSGRLNAAISNDQDSDHGRVIYNRFSDLDEAEHFKEVPEMISCYSSVPMIKTGRGDWGDNYRMQDEKSWSPNIAHQRRDNLDFEGDSWRERNVGLNQQGSLVSASGYAADYQKSSVYVHMNHLKLAPSFMEQSDSSRIMASDRKELNIIAKENLLGDKSSLRNSDSISPLARINEFIQSRNMGFDTSNQNLVQQARSGAGDSSGSSSPLSGKTEPLPSRGRGFSVVAAQNLLEQTKVGAGVSLSLTSPPGGSSVLCLGRGRGFGLISDPKLIEESTVSSVLSLPRLPSGKAEQSLGQQKETCFTMKNCSAEQKTSPQPGQGVSSHLSPVTIISLGVGRGFSKADPSRQSVLENSNTQLESSSSAQFDDAGLSLAHIKGVFTAAEKCVVPAAEQSLRFLSSGNSTPQAFGSSVDPPAFDYKLVSQNSKQDGVTTKQFDNVSTNECSVSHSDITGNSAFSPQAFSTPCQADTPTKFLSHGLSTQSVSDTSLVMLKDKNGGDAKVNVDPMTMQQQKSPQLTLPLTMKKFEADVKVPLTKSSENKEIERLLDSFINNVSCVPRQLELPVVTRQDRPQLRPIFGTVVYGKGIPTPQFQVVNIPFQKDVQKVLMVDMDIDIPKGVQAWIWPAILGCRHVVGICPPNGGKTMSYVPALISMVSNKDSYIELPKGKGPVAIVLVSSWKKARKVLETIHEFTEGLRHFKSQVVYAGGMEENDKIHVSLMQGCDVLISTPRSLLRLLDQDVTSLKRLCHIVLDDADLLSTKFQKEVMQFMHLYKLVLTDRKESKRHTSEPRQVMIFANQWNPGVDQFRLRFTKEPVIAISSRVEASVYGGVRQIVTMTKHEHRLSTLCGLLDSLSGTPQRLVAFTQELEEADLIYQAAHSRSIYCLLIHQELPVEAIELARATWIHSSQSNTMLMMVCTDQCYEDLAITNATMVVHYGLPDSKTKLGNRMACMLDYFLDRTTNVVPEVEPISHVILTDASAAKAKSLYDILIRCPATFSPQLEKFIQGYRMGLENDERKSLCHYLKAFGTCSDQDRCGFRHLIIPGPDFKTGEVTQNTLPSSGEIKVKVVYVKNASCYYCHLVEHRSVPDNVRTDLRIEYQRLVMEMVTFYSKESNHQPYLPSQDPFLDGVCTFKHKSGAYYRVRVLSRKRKSVAVSETCKLWLVDFGIQDECSLDQLLKLPPSLADVPYQAVEVYLCSVKPKDGDNEWTCEADTFIQKLIGGKELIGRITLSAGGTLWLQPLVHQVMLKSVGVSSDTSIRQELLDNQFADPNQEHISLLYKLFRGKVEIPENLMRQFFDYVLELELRQETLEGGEQHEVTIAAVTSPDLFYVQKWNNFEQLEELNEKIKEFINKDNVEIDSRTNKTDADIKLEKGSVCLALSSDDRWYRTRILTSTDTETCDVFLLDYGGKEVVTKKNLRPLPRELADLPCQAIECQLAYLKPIGQNWEQKSVEAICDLAYFVNGQLKQLTVQVVDRTESEYSIGQKLVVDVYEQSYGVAVRFAQELVWKRVACCRDEFDTVKVLIGKPALKNQKFFNLLDKIPYLVANIYWSDTESEAVSQANELWSILASREDEWDTRLVERTVLGPVFQVVGYVPDLEAHGLLLESLVSCCLDSDRLMKLAVEEDLAFILTCCLEQDSRRVIQLQAAEALSQLVGHQMFVDSLVKSSGLVSVLEQLLELNQNPRVDLETLRCVCTACAQLIKTKNESICGNLKSKSTISHVFASLKAAHEDLDREPWLELLAAIAGDNSTHTDLMREAHVACLLDLIQVCSDDKCQFLLMSLFLSLVKGSRRHKTILLESKLLLTLQKLNTRNLRKPCLEVYLQLLEELKLTLPEPESLSGLPACSLNMADSSKIIHPEVTWSQNSFRVLLKIKVKEAKEEDFRISDSRLCCRSGSVGTIYELDWELYDLVVPDRTRINIYTSHAIVSLYKRTQGKWSRLLKQKTRPSQLSLDFDHPYNSDDEDVDCEDNITRLTRQRDLLHNQEMWAVKRERNYDSDHYDSSDDPAVYSHSEDEPAIDMEMTMRTIIGPNLATSSRL